MRSQFITDHAVKDKAALKVNAQGYLVVPSKIGRTGEMDYQGSELGIDGVDKNKFYKVEVHADDLFSEDSMKSFEGKPVTLLHPEGLDVNATNWKEHGVGHIQNVHRDGEFLRADVYVTDAAAISVIQKDGIKELSLGYDCQLTDSNNADFKKTRIVGNHCAIVPSGRAGFDCRLGDKDKRMSKNSLASKLMKTLGKLTRRIGDSDEMGKEELEQALASLNEALTALKEAPDETEGKEEQIANLEAQIADIQAKLDAMKDGEGKETINDDDASTDGGDDAEALKARIQELEEENTALRAELEALKADKDKESALADAKARFPKAKVGDAKNARQVYEAVLGDSGIFSKPQLGSMSNAEIKAAYLGYVASNGKKSNVGKVLLGDANKKAVSASKRLGGK